MLNSNVKENCVRSKKLCGGAIYSTNSSVLLNATTFINNHAKGSSSNSSSTNRNRDPCTERQCGGAVFATSHSNLNINNCTFEKNTAYLRGGAIYTDLYTKVNITLCAFRLNTAKYGGAISLNTTLSDISFTDVQYEAMLHKNEFVSNSVTYHGGAVHCNGGVFISESIFSWNQAKYKTGGAIAVKYGSVIKIVNNIFNCNTAKQNGGGIRASSYNNFTIHITNSTFNNNSAIISGGSVYVKVTSDRKHRKNVKLQLHVDMCLFEQNNAESTGGALCAEASDSKIIASTFSNNSAIEYGGAIHFERSVVHIKEGNFINNCAAFYGGAISALSCDLTSSVYINITRNIGKPGVLYVLNGNITFRGKTSITDNEGSIFAFNSNVTFEGECSLKGNNVTYNISSKQLTTASLQEGGALTGVQSDIFFKGNVYLINNYARSGGAIKVTELSWVVFYKTVSIVSNTAVDNGGGIFAYQCDLTFRGNVRIAKNSAKNKGGGVFATASTMSVFEGSLRFINNSAFSGGGLTLYSNAKIYMIKEEAECKKGISHTCYSTNPNKWLKLEFISNWATNFGGAIYINDNTTFGICETQSKSHTNKAKVSECSMQVLAFYRPYSGSNLTNIHVQNINFTENKAQIAGSNIYGGLLDRCSVSPLAETLLNRDNDSNSVDAVSHLFRVTNIENKTTIASDAVRVWFCKNNQPDSNYRPSVFNVKRGELFLVDIVAVNQVDNIVNATIHSTVSSPETSRLNETQTYQNINDSCSTLQFNVFSSEPSQIISFYAIGPCNGRGISKQQIMVNFTNCSCPIGFQPSTKENECDCQCSSSLAPHITVTQCFISNKTLARKGEFWIAYSNSSNVADYVIYSNCPYDFCKPAAKITYINLNIAKGEDAQCAYYRSGVLCGSCADGLSLSLGSSRCLKCSNDRIALIIPFALAGIVLVVFLLVFNLTVAVGTLNGLIFYANIVIANRSLFLPFHKPNVMTVFIAWLNLDLGLETCFYNGMDAYAKIWLHLVFPSYLIVLLVIVIIVSEKSSRFAKLLAGRNPVATLVTVILLSYTKLLRTIIYALAVANINYPDSVHTVWLFDGNVDYLKGKHIPLFIAAVIIIIVGLVFTFILFSWQWILQLSDKIRVLRWITNPKFHSIMDAYHAPFNPKHRYWSGLLLFVRVMLYVLSAVNINEDSRASLVIINITMTCLIVFKLWFGNRMYKKWILNILEDVFIINIIIFAVATKYMKNNNLNTAQLALAYTSTSVAIVIFCGILVYHTFTFVIDIKVAKKVFFYLQQCQKKFSIFSHDKEEYDTQLEKLIGKPSSTDYRLAEISTTEQPVTTTVVSL